VESYGAQGRATNGKATLRQVQIFEKGKHMSKLKEKTTGFCFKMSQEEWDMLDKRMAEVKIKNKSAFIRKMAIDGFIINLDCKELTEIGRLLRITSNNVNQIAVRVNSGGQVYRNEIESVNSQLTEIRIMFGKLLSIFTEIGDSKPGKYSVPVQKILNRCE
jgi:hypothetical protein